MEKNDPKEGENMVSRPLKLRNIHLGHIRGWILENARDLFLTLHALGKSGQ